MHTAEQAGAGLVHTENQRSRVYGIQLIKEASLANLHRVVFIPGRVKGYGDHFPNSLSTPVLSPPKKALSSSSEPHPKKGFSSPPWVLDMTMAM